MSRQKILMVVGTRPECIKMAPLYRAFHEHSELFETKLCITSQHKEMLQQVMDFFGMAADYDLDIMRPNQTLNLITATILTELKPVLESYQPDYTFVHGDTTTTLATSLAAYYAGVKVAHVEAGLRSFNKKAPFPEEVNRLLTSQLADLHFAPTNAAKNNLLREGIAAKQVIVTGNTVIDALLLAVAKLNSSDTTRFHSHFPGIDFSKRIVLVTGHRRENFGEGFENICSALREIALQYPDVEIVYPVHLNPRVQEPVHRILSGLSNVHLVKPQPYEEFVWLMNRAYLIITDSGGVQEEAPSLGKPVLVMREVTERPEAVEAGTVILVGTDTGKIVAETTALLNKPKHYAAMTKLHNPYGDGNACHRIISYMSAHL